MGVPPGKNKFMISQGLEEYCQESRFFNRKLGRNSGKSKFSRLDTGFDRITRKAGFTKSWHEMRYWDIGTRDSREREQDRPSRP